MPGVSRDAVGPHHRDARGLGVEGTVCPHIARKAMPTQHPSWGREDLGVLKERRGGSPECRVGQRAQSMPHACPYRQQHSV